MFCILIILHSLKLHLFLFVKGYNKPQYHSVGKVIRIIITILIKPKLTSMFRLNNLFMVWCTFTSTVKSAYKEPAYKELSVIRNWFSFPNLNQETSNQGTSSLYVCKEFRLRNMFSWSRWVSNFYCTVHHSSRYLCRFLLSFNITWKL